MQQKKKRKIFVIYLRRNQIRIDFERTVETNHRLMRQRNMRSRRLFSRSRRTDSLHAILRGHSRQRYDEQFFTNVSRDRDRGERSI